MPHIFIGGQIGLLYTIQDISTFCYASDVIEGIVKKVPYM